MFAKNLARQRDVKTLMSFFETEADGVDVLWIRVEDASKVKMDSRGRQLARTALRKLRRPYLSIRGDGITLSSPDNALDVMGQRFKTMDRSARRAERTHTDLSTRHYDQMTGAVQQRMTAVAMLFGEVRAIAKSADKHVFARMKMHAARVLAREGVKQPPGI